MTIIQSIVLGAIEGVTEFLPISSTAHLMIASKLMGLDQSAFVKSFEIAIQLGAVCAVLFLYAKTLLRNTAVIPKIIAGFIPTAIIGFILYKFIKSYLLGNFAVIFWALLLGGIFFIGFEMYMKKKFAAIMQSGTGSQQITDVAKISYKKAAIIGTVQALAVIPGVSRSAATILSAMMLDVSRSTAVEFSFLLALPTVAAATGYDALKNLDTFSGNWGAIVVGFIVAFITAIFAVKFLISFVRRHTFTPFGVYRIVLALLVLSFILH